MEQKVVQKQCPAPFTNDNQINIHIKKMEGGLTGWRWENLRSTPLQLYDLKPNMSFDLFVIRLMSRKVS